MPALDWPDPGEQLTAFERFTDARYQFAADRIKVRIDGAVRDGDFDRPAGRRRDDALCKAQRQALMRQRKILVVLDEERESRGSRIAGGGRGELGAYFHRERVKASRGMAEDLRQRHQASVGYPDRHGEPTSTLVAARFQVRRGDQSADDDRTRGKPAQARTYLVDRVSDASWRAAGPLAHECDLVEDHSVTNSNVNGPQSQPSARHPRIGAAYIDARKRDLRRPDPPDGERQHGITRSRRSVRGECGEQNDGSYDSWWT